MPFVALLWNALAALLPYILGRAVIALGFGVISYTGISVTLTWLKTEAVARIQSLPPEVVGMLSVLKVGVCINIVLSAMVARLVINGLQSDTLKRWVTK